MWQVGQLKTLQIAYLESSFDIVDRRSHYSTNLMKSARDERTNSPDEDSKSPLVVEQDARVVGGERRIMSSPEFRRLL